MSNMGMTSNILQWLKAQGVRDVCLCPGGRNSPFVEHFTKRSKDFQVHTSFDERAAGFFALGLALKHQQPVAVITTSGTAVAEVLPSVMEAHYAGIPLIVISADRPRRLRGTGAPQAVEQVGIFGAYVESCIDLEKEFIAPTWGRRRPLHINICFDEPLIDGEPVPLKKMTLLKENFSPVERWSDHGFEVVSNEILQQDFAQFLKDKKQPLLLVSTLLKNEVDVVRPFVESWPGPVYCEAPSGLRELAKSRQLISGDRILVHAWREKKIDAVVRIGGVPTARLWRNLESSEFPIFSLSSRPFPGLSRGEFFHAEYDRLSLLGKLIPEIKPPSDSLLAKDKELHDKWSQLLEKYPKSEPSLMAWISRQIPNESTLYLGNSLPIREWDLVAQRETPLHALANRGANGIDGQLSTALAFLDSKKPLWAILGDLTTLYDSNALWFWRSSNTELKLIVINNGGGQIFSRMFQSPLFCNSHNLNFSAWAGQWSLPYLAVTEPLTIPPKSCLLEIQPNEKQTKDFWREYDALWEIG